MNSIKEAISGVCNFVSTNVHNGFDYFKNAPVGIQVAIGAVALGAIALVGAAFYYVGKAIFGKETKVEEVVDFEKETTELQTKYNDKIDAANKAKMPAENEDLKNAIALKSSLDAAKTNFDADKKAHENPADGANKEELLKKMTESKEALVKAKADAQASLEKFEKAVADAEVAQADSLKNLNEQKDLLAAQQKDALKAIENQKTAWETTKTVGAKKVSEGTRIVSYVSNIKADMEAKLYAAADKQKSLGSNILDAQINNSRKELKDKLAEIQNSVDTFTLTVEDDVKFANNTARRVAELSGVAGIVGGGVAAVLGAPLLLPGAAIAGGAALIGGAYKYSQTQRV
jgi:hypothetical protein